MNLARSTSCATNRASANSKRGICQNVLPSAVSVNSPRKSRYSSTFVSRKRVICGCLGRGLSLQQSRTFKSAHIQRDETNGDHEDQETLEKAFFDILDSSTQPSAESLFSDAAQAEPSATEDFTPFSNADKVSRKHAEEDVPSPFSHSTRTTTKDPSSFILKTLTSPIRSISANYLQQDIEDLDFETIGKETHKSLDILLEYISQEEKEFFGEEKYLVASISLQLVHRYEQVMRKLGVTDYCLHDLSAVEKWIHIWDICEYKEQIYEIYEKTKAELLTRQGEESTQATQEEIVMESEDTDENVFVQQSETEQVSEENMTEIMDTGKYTSSRVEDRHEDLIDVVPEFTRLKTFYRVIKTLAHVSRTEYIVFILNHLRERQLGMVPETFALVIDSCENDEATDVALRYFDVMHQEGIEPTASVIASLLKVFIAAKDPNFIDVYKSFAENHTITEHESIMLEEILFRGLTEVVHDFQTSLELLDLLEQKGRRISRDEYHVLIEAARQRGSKLDAIRIYEHMTNKGVSPDLYVCERLCQTYAQHGDPKTFQIYHVLNQKYGFNDKKTIGIYNAFIQVAAIHHNHAKIKQLMRQMRQDGLRPNVVTHLHYGVSLYHTNWKSRMEAYLKTGQKSNRNLVSKVPEDSLPFEEDLDSDTLNIESSLRSSSTRESEAPVDEDLNIFEDALLMFESEQDEEKEAEKPKPSASNVSAFNPELRKELESRMGKKAYLDLLAQAQDEYQQDDMSDLRDVPETTEELFGENFEYEQSYDEDFVPSNVDDLFDSLEASKKHTPQQMADQALLNYLAKRAAKTAGKSSSNEENSERKESKEETV